MATVSTGGTPMVDVSEAASLDAILTVARGKAFAVIVVVEETSKLFFHSAIPPK